MFQFQPSVFTTAAAVQKSTADSQPNYVTITDIKFMLVIDLVALLT